MIFLVLPGFAQDAPQPAEPTVKPDVDILESRFSTTTPVVGDTLTYFLKFDSVKGLRVHPVEQFSEQGLTVVEKQHLAPQEFKGRMIQQYQYTLRPDQPGTFQFSPASIQFDGPHVNPIAAVADPAQLTVSSIVDVQVVSNSPVMLGEALELRLKVVKRKPVTMSAMPQTLSAVFHASEPDKTSETDQTTDKSDVPPTPTPQPASLEFVLDQSQQVTPQQIEGQTVEEYQYLVSAQPTVAGEYVIPEFTVTYRTAGGEEVQQVVKPTQIFVLNPNTDNLDIATDYHFLVVPAIIAAALLVGGLLGFLYLKYRKPRQTAVLRIPPPLPPGDVAHRELAEIQAMHLPSKGQFKEYYTFVSESVRKFLGAEYHFPVLERTTGEILTDIQAQNMPDAIKRQVSNFLPEADMVKFAKYTPTLEQADKVMEEALRIVDESLAYHQPTSVAEETTQDTAQ